MKSGPRPKGALTIRAAVLSAVDLATWQSHKQIAAKIPDWSPVTVKNNCYALADEGFLDKREGRGGPGGHFNEYRLAAESEQ